VDPKGSLEFCIAMGFYPEVGCKNKAHTRLLNDVRFKISNRRSC
jgi:hypothetical protein